MMILGYTAFLFAFWLMLSGYLTPLMLSFGVASVLLTVVLARRMTLIDHQSYPLHLSSKMPGYLFAMMREIVKANFDVIKRIIKRDRRSVSPSMIEIEPTLKTDLGRVIYANSITLTPGTVTVEMTREKIVVHALSKEAAEELASGLLAEIIPDKKYVRKK